MEFQKFNINPGGRTQAFDHYLCSMSGEFDFSLGRVGNLNRKFQVELLNTIQCVWQHSLIDALFLI